MITEPALSTKSNLQAALLGLTDITSALAGMLC